LLKRLLALLSTRARRIGALAARTAARLERAEGGPRLERVRTIAARCAEAQRRLRELRAADIFAEVGPLPAFRGPTPLLQRDPAYREVYRTWLALHRTPLATVDSPLFDIPIADLPHLYEGWCALQVAHALLDLGGQLVAQRLVTASHPEDAPPDDLDLAVALVDQAPLLRIRLADTLLTLRYQPRYRPARPTTNDQRPTTGGGDRDSSFVVRRSPFVSLDRHTRVPDLAVEVERAGESPRVLLLDAKYRLDAEGGVPQDALADAYAYLGAVGWRGTRATIGALLLYPGRGTPERYPSGVGALPLLPGAADDLPRLLADWLDLPRV
ncbi:MAG TPA: DUF2357 domain-containing protein, partial [Roseiflexaceae bacterium]|nr:DUF2357 domain-containing protein [Roseiflexaceae bacterium]